MEEQLSLEQAQKKEGKLSKGIEDSMQRLEKYDLTAYISEIKDIIRDRRSDVDYDGASLAMQFMRALGEISLPEPEDKDKLDLGIPLGLPLNQMIAPVHFSRELLSLYLMASNRAQVQAVIGGFNIEPTQMAEFKENQGNALMEDALDRFVPEWRSFFEETESK